MICKNCGGQLNLIDGFYICDNCSSKMSLMSAYENIEIFIAYIENDEFGRRTKDSIIAGNIYNRLENYKLHSFYQRISTSELMGETFEKVCDYCLDSAKILLIVGCSIKNFELIIDKYSGYFSSKTIIPIFSEVEIKDLPNQISSLQAVNYNNVGAINDLCKKVAHILGKESEIDFLTETNRNLSKKRKISIVSIIVAVVLILSALIYTVFFTPYVLDSKKYAYAQSMIENENYIEAIDTLLNIKDYENTDSLLKSIYDKYIGYYQSEDEKIRLHFNIINNVEAVVEIDIKNNDNGFKITESVQVDGDTMSFEFTDSQNNYGNANVILTNQGVELKLSSDSYTDIDSPYIFSLENKSDKPLAKKVTSKEISEWLSKRYTKKQIENQGYNLTFVISDPNTTWSKYNIENTNIYIDFFKCNETEFNDAMYNAGKKSSEDIAYAFAAPAEFIAPDIINKDTKPYIKNDIMYVPNTMLYAPSQTGPQFAPEDYELKKVKNDTLVGFTSKKLLGEYSWKEFNQEFVYDYYLGDFAMLYLAENDDYYITTPSSGFDKSTTPIYKIHKRTYEVTYIQDIPYINDYSTKYIDTTAFPELFDGFYILTI